MKIRPRTKKSRHILNLTEKEADLLIHICNEYDDNHWPREKRQASYINNIHHVPTEVIHLQSYIHLLRKVQNLPQ